jgi:hypothetical protein
MPFQFETGSACTAASDTLSTADAATASAVWAASKSRSLAAPAATDIPKLQRVVETASHDRNLTGEPALNLVGQCKRQKEIRAACAGVLGDREHGTEIVCGVAKTTWREEGVEQIGVAHQYRVEEGSLIHRSLSTSDQRGGGPPAELLGMVPDVGYQLAIHGADGACDGVENVALQRREDICGEILAPRTDDEIGDVFDNVSIRHGHLFVMGIYSSWASIRHGHLFVMALSRFRSGAIE